MLALILLNMIVTTTTTTKATNPTSSLLAFDQSNCALLPLHQLDSVSNSLVLWPIERKFSTDFQISSNSSIKFVENSNISLFQTSTILYLQFLHRINCKSIEIHYNYENQSDFNHFFNFYAHLEQNGTIDSVFNQLSNEIVCDKINWDWKIHLVFASQHQQMAHFIDCICEMKTYESDTVYIFDENPLKQLMEADCKNEIAMKSHVFWLERSFNISSSSSLSTCFSNSSNLMTKIELYQYQQRSKSIVIMEVLNNGKLVKQVTKPRWKTASGLAPLSQITQRNQWQLYKSTATFVVLLLRMLSVFQMSLVFYYIYTCRYTKRKPFGRILILIACVILNCGSDAFVANLEPSSSSSSPSSSSFWLLICVIRRYSPHLGFSLISGVVFAKSLGMYKLVHDQRKMWGSSFCLASFKSVKSRFIRNMDQLRKEQHLENYSLFTSIFVILLSFLSITLRHPGGHYQVENQSLGDSENSFAMVCYFNGSQVHFQNEFISYSLLIALTLISLILIISMRHSHCVTDMPDYHILSTALIVFAVVFFVYICLLIANPIFYIPVAAFLMIIISLMSMFIFCELARILQA